MQWTILYLMIPSDYCMAKHGRFASCFHIHMYASQELVMALSTKGANFDYCNTKYCNLAILPNPNVSDHVYVCQCR